TLDSYIIIYKILTKLSRIVVPVLKNYYDGILARAIIRYSQHLVKKVMIKHRVMSENYLNCITSMESKKQDELITITTRLSG
ncbi:uncharacterized protein METZ01_LOCUS127112, partial [marine metagenome]